MAAPAAGQLHPLVGRHHKFQPYGYGECKDNAGSNYERSRVRRSFRGGSAGHGEPEREGSRAEDRVAPL
jgi:hypothetical protein